MNDGLSCRAVVSPLIVRRTSLVVQRPSLLGTLRQPFATIYAIENVFGVICNVICSVFRWRAPTMIYHWVGFGVASSERGLLRITVQKASTALVRTFGADADDFNQEAAYPS